MLHDVSPWPSSSPAGPSPIDRAEIGSKIHALSDRAGTPLFVGISAGNTNDAEALEPASDPRDPVATWPAPPEARETARDTAAIVTGGDTLIAGLPMADYGPRRNTRTRSDGVQVLLSASGTRGDIEPALGLALRLQELGAHVRVCAPPNFEGRLTELGVPLVPLGPPIPGSDGAKASMAELLDYVDQWPAVQFDTIPTAAARCDAVIATGITEIAARSAAEKLGIHYQYASYQPTSLPSLHHPPMPRIPGERPAPAGIGNQLLWEIDAEGWNAQFGEALDTRRAALGLPPVGNVRDHVVTDRPWLAADPVLGPWPESPGLDVVQTGAWIVPDERPLPAELEAFLDAGTPPVYIGFGSMQVRNGIARLAIEAVRAHNRRVLLSRGWAELSLIDDLSDCMAVGEVNHQALFPRVAAVIHHGGAGTTTTAARAGVPQVVVPQMTDQAYWARRVADLGIGTACEDADPDPASLSAALDTALTSTTRARASAVAGTIRADGATVAAKLLIDAIR